MAIASNRKRNSPECTKGKNTPAVLADPAHSEPSLWSGGPCGRARSAPGRGPLTQRPPFRFETPPPPRLSLPGYGSRGISPWGQVSPSPPIPLATSVATPSLMPARWWDRVLPLPWVAFCHPLIEGYRQPITSCHGSGVGFRCGCFGFCGFVFFYRWCNRVSHYLLLCKPCFSPWLFLRRLTPLPVGLTPHERAACS